MACILHLAGKLSLLDQTLAPGRQPFHLGFELLDSPVAELFLLCGVLLLRLVLGDRVLQHLGNESEQDWEKVG